MIEASEAGRPVAQRVIDVHTTAALCTARLSEETTSSALVEVAESQLHELVRRLDDNWKPTNAKQTRALLTTMSGHWCALEVAPGAMFGVVHKAPFIPAEHLARIHYGRACVTSPAVVPRLQLPAVAIEQVPAKEIADIFTRWVNMDIPHGEDHARRKGLRNELLLLRKNCESNVYAWALIDLHLADQTSDAPYRQIEPSTAQDYHPKYAIFFSYCAREGTFELDPEVFAEAFQAMGGEHDPTTSGAARSSMLHICAFLSSRGYSCPSGFLDKKGAKTAKRPRLPVYTSDEEVETVVRCLTIEFQGRGGTFAFAPTQVRLQRRIPLRASEVRYANTADVDAHAGLLIVSSSGHAHLKTRHSRGYLPLPADIQGSIDALWRARLSPSPARATKLFAEPLHTQKPFAAHDAVCDAIQRHAAIITGCPEFRAHDFRASAATDIAFPLQATLRALFAGERTIDRPLTGEQLASRHARFSKATRMSRHASALTTLRYYVLSGMVDLHVELGRAALEERLSYRYAAAGAGHHALEAKLSRARASGVTKHEH